MFAFMWLVLPRTVEVEKGMRVSELQDVYL